MSDEWKLDDTESLPQEDSLLTCLVLLARFYKNPCSASALASGLPLENNRLTPRLFDRAAQRAGLTAQLQKRKLNHISSLALPAVLLLRNQNACLLLNMNSDEAEVILAEAPEVKTKIPLSELKKDYLNHVIFVRPLYEEPKRGEQVIAPVRKHWFWSVFRKTIPIYGEVILASGLVNLFALAVPLFTMNIYNRVIPNNAVDTLWVLTIGILLVFLFDFILKTLRSYFIDHVSKATDIHLSSILFSHVLDIKMASRPNSIGALVNSIQSFEFFRDFITSTTIAILIDIPFFFLFVFVLFLVGGNIGFIPLLMMPFVLLVGLILQAPLINLTRRSYAYGAEKHAILYESLSGAETIKTEIAEGHLQGRWERVIGLAARLGVKLRFMTNFGMNFSILTQQLVTIIIVIFGVYKIAHGDLTTGGLIACLMLGSRALTPITQATILLTKYFQSNNALKSINTIMQLPIERPADRKPLHVNKLQGNIVFDKISFSYRVGSPPALKNVSFKIKSGEKVGFIGRLGSGKTTIAKLILGLYQAQEGTILLDDIEINQIDPADVRRNMGYVPQDINLFNTTIRENILLRFPGADDEKLLKALEISGVDRFTKTHPQGIDWEVGEGGKNLSGGQRQAVVIARSLIGNPNIFVFDEPTNSMDDNSELYFLKKFQEHYSDRTLILITHRASMLQLVDRLIVLDQGMVMADGPKDKVLEALKAKLVSAKT